MKKVKKILKIILIALIFGITYSFFFTAYENIKYNKAIENFKNRGILQDMILINENKNHYQRHFEVPRETSHELNDNKIVFNTNNRQLGVDGDIFTTKQSPFPETKFFHAFMTFYYGGHAAILNYDDYGFPYFIEATGYPAEGETIFDYIFHDGVSEHELNSTAYNNPTNYWQSTTTSDNYYYDMFYRSKYVGLRLVNHFVGDEKEELYEDYIEAAIEFGKEKIASERLYNFLFFLNMKNKYYCTDLVSRVYEEAYEKVYNENDKYQSKGYAKKLNDDGFITSVQDLVLSKDTFIIFYVEITKEEEKIIENIYYLAEPK